MANISDFESFLTQGTVQVNPVSIVISLLLAGLLGYILSILYIRYGESLSNRKIFAKNFVLLATTTALIIFIVKSSLALSLGLVGALSIVRFRSAIKEPEELIFLFICISIGLGVGAGQIQVTILSFIIISAFIMARHHMHKNNEEHDMHLVISGKNIELEQITQAIRKHATTAKLRRFDQAQDNTLEAAYSVEIKSFKELEKLREELAKLSKTINITYLDKVEV